MAAKSYPIRLDEEIIKRVDSIAERELSSRTRIMRLAVFKFVGNYENAD